MRTPETRALEMRWKTVHLSRREPTTENSSSSSTKKWRSWLLTRIGTQRLNTSSPRKKEDRLRTFPSTKCAKHRQYPLFSQSPVSRNIHRTKSSLLLRKRTLPNLEHHPKRQKEFENHENDQVEINNLQKYSHFQPADHGPPAARPRSLLRAFSTSTLEVHRSPKIEDEVPHQPVVVAFLHLPNKFRLFRIIPFPPRQIATRLLSEELMLLHCPIWWQPCRQMIFWHAMSWSTVVIPTNTMEDTSNMQWICMTPADVKNSSSDAFLMSGGYPSSTVNTVRKGGPECEWPRTSPFTWGFCRAAALRGADRIRNVDRYPHVSFEEIYVLDKGYKGFYEALSRTEVQVDSL